MRRSPGPSAPPRPRSAERCSGRSSCCATRWSRRGWRMQCRSVLTRIDALRTGELPPIEETAVERHLETCRSCGASRSDVVHLADAVKSLAVLQPRSCREEIADSFDRVETDAGAVWVAFSAAGIRMITAAGSPAESTDDLRSAYA